MVNTSAGGEVQLQVVGPGGRRRVGSRAVLARSAAELREEVLRRLRNPGPGPGPVPVSYLLTYLLTYTYLRIYLLTY